MDSVLNPAASLGEESAEETHVKNLSDESAENVKSCEDYHEAREHFELASNDDEDEDEFYDFSPVELIQQSGSSNENSVADAVSNSIQNFITRRRNELALELRSLQFSNRLVDETNAARNRLEEFFNNSLSTNVEAPRGNVAPPSTVQYRSPTVQNEIEQLNNLNRVSDVLSTSRANIERTLQNLLQRHTAPTVNNNANNTSISNNTPAQNNTTATRQHQNEQTNTNRTVDNRPVNTRQWLLESSDPNSVEQVLREQIVGEIGELVHRQVVSNALRSEFRTTLEDRVLARLRTIGADGERTQQFIRSLPTTAVVRNDFSHLGVNVTNEDVALDSASSLNETRVRRVVTSNTREIRELKSEINELKSMLKLSFEVQLDMQRSLKQEISALIAGTFNNATSSQLISSTRPANEGKCVICTDSAVDSVLYQCGHMCTCYVCSLNLKQKNHNCPVCRAPILDVLRTYRVGLQE